VKAISIRQPWAWLIVAGHKDVENRTWRTQYRGPILIHASKGTTKREYNAAWTFAFCGHDIPAKAIYELPKFEDLERGGIIGMAELVDVVPPYRRESPWHMDGCQGFKMKNVRPLPFIPFDGRLNIFEVPDSLLVEHAPELFKARAA
jgi:hypothetical protein